MKVQEEDKIAGPARMNERIRRDRELSRKTFQEQTHDLILRARPLRGIATANFMTWIGTVSSIYKLFQPSDSLRGYGISQYCNFSTDIWQEWNRVADNGYRNGYSSNLHWSQVQTSLLLRFGKGGLAGSGGYEWWNVFPCGFWSRSVTFEQPHRRLLLVLGHFLVCWDRFWRWFCAWRGCRAERYYFWHDAAVWLDFIPIMLRSFDMIAIITSDTYMAIRCIYWHSNNLNLEPS